MPNPNNCLRYWDLADPIRIDDARQAMLPDGSEAAEMGSLKAIALMPSDKRGLLSFNKELGEALKRFAPEINRHRT